MTEYSGFVAIVSAFVLFVLDQMRRQEIEAAREVEQDPAVVHRRRDAIRRGTIQMTVVFVLSVTAALGFGTIGAVVTVAALFLAPTLARGRLRRPWVWRGSSVILGFMALVVIVGSAADREAVAEAAEQPPGIAAPIAPEADSTPSQVGGAATAESVVEPATPQTRGGAQPEPPSTTSATASDLPEPPVAAVPAAPPPVRNVAFTIESHPVGAPIYVSTNPAREAERNIGTGSVTISVPPGTEITYSIRPSSSSGFEPFYGRLTVQQAATHPVWLTPRPRVSPPNVAAFPWNSPERVVADWFAAYAREDWNAMVNMTLRSQLRSGRQIVFNGIEGTYFFREYRQLVSLNRASGDDVVAHINVVWEHDLGRSASRIMVIRENAAGHPDRNGSWRVSYLSAMGVRDAP